MLYDMVADSLVLADTKLSAAMLLTMWDRLFLGILVLTQCGLVTWATEIWINIASGNGLLPNGTKPLPDPKLTDHQLSPVTFILGQFYKRCLNHQSLKSVWISHAEISFKFPRGQLNELRANKQGFPGGYPVHLLGLLCQLFCLIHSSLGSNGVTSSGDVGQ